MLAPRVLPGCASRHAFCEPCIRFWLQLQRDSGLPPTCPIDRRVVKDDERISRDPALEAKITHLEVRCPNYRLGCTARFELGDGTAHLDTCAFRLCNARCGKLNRAKKLRKVTSSAASRAARNAE